MIWGILGIIGVAVLLAVAIMDKTARQLPLPEVNEENLRQSLRKFDVEVSVEEVAAMSDRDYDACWRFIDAKLGGSRETISPRLLSSIRRRATRRDGIAGLPGGARRYEIQTIGLTPEWWPQVFYRHQLELRALLRDLMAAPGMATAAREDFSLVTMHYDPREVGFALSRMVEDGVLTLVDGRYARPKEVPYPSSKGGE